MAIRLRPNLVLLAGLPMLLAALLQVGQAQEMGTFTDDDPDNDPNVCYTVSDPESCDWERGWYQAALNMGYITLETAQAAYPDMQVTDWLPEAVKREREAELESLLQRYEDDDPTNDPNLCFQSADPNCDWVQGWFNAIYTTATFIKPGDVTSLALRASFRSWLEAKRAYELANPLPDPDDLPPGAILYLDISWLCPRDFDPLTDPDGCPRPSRQCGPGDDPTLGGCYIVNQ